MTVEKASPAKLVHAMIRVLDEDRSLAFYEKAFGLLPVERLVFDNFTLIYLRNETTAFELELTVNHDRVAPYALGDGYGHLAVTVSDVESEHERHEASGLMPGPICVLSHNNQPVARFSFVQDPDGYKIEVIERGGRFV